MEISRETRRKWRVVALLISFLALGSTAVAPAFAAPSPEPTSPIPTYGSPGAGTPATWALVPVDTKGDLDGRSKYAYTAKPGAVIKDMMGVANFSTQALTLKIEAIDAFNTAEGQFALLQTGEKSTDLGAWITGKETRVTVPARTRLSIPFTLRVPADASPGDHIAGLVATAVQGGTGSKEQKVAVNFRTGTRVYLRVTGAIKARLAIENVSAEYSQTINPLGRGKAVINYRVVNRGNVRLAGSGTITVQSINGVNVAPSQNVSVSELLPGQFADVSVEINDVAPVGLLKATIDLKPIAARGVSAPTLTDARASVWFAAFSVSLGLLLFGLVTFLVLWMLRIRPGISGPGGNASDSNDDPAPAGPSSNSVDSDVDLGALV